MLGKGKDYRTNPQLRDYEEHKIVTKMFTITQCSKNLALVEIPEIDLNKK